ncbi:unnamed protein product [Acanthoscelides obtectus]|uniref:Uncharacterized protein n=1 Tax=Acanthoscelides obtectus TaxID=200917 RepID=A0A9P0L8W4_ACAOB|nr:unnamed protein product [Acanthoscelides obtectus]CAK1656812.1 hypothetical protein AOBTE_LOCUS19927 [Acanthoscelides obtectus]
MTNVVGPPAVYCDQKLTLFTKQLTLILSVIVCILQHIVVSETRTAEIHSTA